MPMNFRKRRPEEPEINLIPFIDVLLVVLIFLMLSTTYSKFAELQVTLPTANAEKPQDRPHEIIVSVTAEGHCAVNGKPVDGRSIDLLAAELSGAAAGSTDAIVIISADAMSAHQSVINVMDAARRVGLVRLTFATQTTATQTTGTQTSATPTSATPTSAKPTGAKPTTATQTPSGVPAR